MNIPGQRAVAASHIFDGTAVHRDTAIIIENDTIAALVPRSDLPHDIAIANHDGMWIAPGFIDVQVNGGGGVLFNNEPSTKTIASIVATHRRFGTTSLMPTLISDTTETMQAAIDAVKAARESQPGVLGIHLEGPYLSPQRPGVHAARYIRPPSSTDAEWLVKSRSGAMLVTLAPEQVPLGFIKRLVASGIQVSLGHSAASYAQTHAAITEGLSGFTHLFNAMPPLMAREPGPVAAALESPSAYYSLIVDGVHVDPAMLRLALRGAGRPILITDGMPPVGGMYGSFTLYGEEISAAGNQCRREDGTLAGACLDMASAVRNCVRMLGVPLERALGFASLHPAQFLGLDKRLGRIAPGYRADLVAFDPRTVEVAKTWVAGE